MPVVLTGGRPRSAPLVRGVAAAAGLPAAGARPVRWTLPGLAWLVAGAALLVCGDTGVAHLGTAFGTPSVLLFGPVPPSRWRPLADPNGTPCLWYGERAARPAGSPTSSRPARPG